MVIIRILILLFIVATQRNECHPGVAAGVRRIAPIASTYNTHLSVWML